MTIAVAGGTGVVGRHVVRVAESRGHEVVLLTRGHGVDLTTGTGLRGRLDGVDAVVDVVSVAAQGPRASERFFAAVTERLLAEGSSAGVRHHVALSIVGIDRVPLGYYAGKRLQERLVEQGAVPWSILRATQFHEFASQALDFVRLGPVSLVPRMRSQTVAAREVAEALVDLAAGPACGRVPDLAGPEVHDMVELARRVNAATRRRRRVVGVRMPGRAGREMAGGGLLPTTDGPRGSVTFDEWLANG